MLLKNENLRNPSCLISMAKNVGEGNVFLFPAKDEFVSLKRSAFRAQWNGCIVFGGRNFSPGV